MIKPCGPTHYEGCPCVMERTRREAVTAYYDAVCRKAEEIMEYTGKVEGAHYAAMQRVRNEMMESISFSVERGA